MCIRDRRTWISVAGCCEHRRCGRDDRDTDHRACGKSPHGCPREIPQHVSPQLPAAPWCLRRQAGHTLVPSLPGYFALNIIYPAQGATVLQPAQACWSSRRRRDTTSAVPPSTISAVPAMAPGTARLLPVRGKAAAVVGPAVAEVPVEAGFVQTPWTAAETLTGPLSPAPVAVRVFAPQFATVTAKTKTPFASAVAVPTGTPLSSTVTVVFGVNPPAVNVTDSPCTVVPALTDGGNAGGAGYGAAKAGEPTAITRPTPKAPTTQRRITIAPLYVSVAVPALNVQRSRCAVTRKRETSTSRCAADIVPGMRAGDGRRSVSCASRCAGG